MDNFILKNPNRNQTIKWILREQKNKIFVQQDIIDRSIRGIYGIFSLNKDHINKKCLYIGKAINIYSRLFVGNGHIVRIKKKDYPFSIFEDCMENSEKILKIEVLKEVKYKLDDYNRDAQRLAYQEYYFIEEYQKKGECLYQLPEGVNKKEKIAWEKIKQTKESE